MMLVPGNVAAPDRCAYNPIGVAPVHAQKACHEIACQKEGGPPMGTKVFICCHTLDLPAVHWKKRKIERANPVIKMWKS
jgi:hypothetical protein